MAGGYTARDFDDNAKLAWEQRCYIPVGCNEQSSFICDVQCFFLIVSYGDSTRGCERLGRAIIGALFHSIPSGWGLRAHHITLRGE